MAGGTNEIPYQLAQNLSAFQSAEAIADLSIYRFYPGEEALFKKYYRPGASILDLACGLGRTTLLLHEMGFAVRGTDCSEVLIAIAKRRLPYLDLQVGSYDCIEEPDCSLDHVLISHNGIDYAFPVAQRLAALRECSRVLKPGGTFIYSSHNIKSLHGFSPYYRDRLRWKLRNTFRALQECDYILEDGVYAFYTSPDYVVKQTEEAGLKLVEMLGFSKLRNRRADVYLSPYVHYVFTKPAVR